MNTIDIDVGGTFTDAFMNYEGKSLYRKVPTTTYDLSVCFLNVIDECAKAVNLSLSDLLPNIDLIRYSTTIAMNRLIERKGPRLGLITTEGFEDTIFIGCGAQWVDGKKPTERRNIALQKKPDPLIPRELVVGVKERIDSNGNIIRVLDKDDVRVKVRYLVDRGVRGFVVSLLHSYINPSHELQVKEIIRDEYKDYHLGLLPVVLSHQVGRVLGEYRRTMTATLNAYLHGAMQLELSAMWDKLREAGYRGSFLMVHNTGGMAEVFKTTAVKTFNGGPVAGLVGSNYIALQLGFKNVVTSDMGGTSFDVGLVVEQSIRSYEFRPVIDVWQVAIPMLRTISIGAGGGSIAWINKLLGRVEVGPQSAGAYPGPACYNLGGTEPTVTDADLVLGYLNPMYFYGGRMPLAEDKAKEAIKSRIADPMGLDLHEAAALIKKIVDGNMASALMKEVYLSGYDPKDFVLFAFGGAGPAHCTGYGAAFPTIITFPWSPVFCARGSSTMDIVHYYEHSKRMLLLEAVTMEPTTDYDVFNNIVNGLIEQARKDLMAEGLPIEQAVFELELDMKYGGQYQEKRVLSPRLSIKSPDDVKAIANQCALEFSEAFSPLLVYPQGGVFVENFILKVTIPSSKPPLPTYDLSPRDPSKALKGKREVFWPEEDRVLETKIYDYDSLRPGNVVEGPAVVEAAYTTTVVPPEWTYEIDAHWFGILRKSGR